MVTHGVEMATVLDRVKDPALQDLTDTTAVHVDKHVMVQLNWTRFHQC